jgi:uncharacterized protein with PIN domain
MTVQIRFYEELNDFLPPARRKRAYEVAWGEPRSVKDLVESQGVPHPEVDLILVNGESVSFDHLVRDHDRVSVYPAFESLDIGAVSQLDRPPLRRLRFVADVHLGKLARRLRLLGFDCLYDPAWDDEQLARCSAEQHRVLLTRDRGLLKRAIVTHGIFLRSGDAGRQLRQVVKRLDLAGMVRPLTRCLACNGEVRPAPKAVVRGRVPPRTYRHIDDYLQCLACGKVYWKGTHWPRLEQIIRHALANP